MIELLLLAPSVLVAVYLIYIGFKLRRMFHTYSHAPSSNPSPVDADALPSVSVCIPARNEMYAMADCLQNVIASTYEKLEILVLDDGSTDNTSALIKSFAHQGVRFIPGKELPQDWLGKNHALETLLQEASGTYVAFLDVDTRITPDTINQLVREMIVRDADMISVVPQRTRSLHAGTLFAPLRYFLELVIHTRKRPAAASSLWIASRTVLREKLGGFEPFKLDVQAESAIAAQLATDGNYSLVISGNGLGVTYDKQWQSQYETGLRLLYPRLGGRLWKGILSLALFGLLWSPIGALMLGIVLHDGSIIAVSAIELTISTFVYGYYLAHIRQAHWWLVMLFWPYIITQESVMLLISMIKYGRGTVTWKGRPVLAPKAIRQLNQSV